MILRTDSVRFNPSMGRPVRLRPSSRPDTAMGRPVRLPPSTRHNAAMGGLWDDFTGAVSSAVGSAIDTTVQSVMIPVQTVQAIATGNVGQVPGLLQQGLNTIPLVGNIIPSGGGGSSSPAPAATASTTATLQDLAAAGITPGTPQYAAALQQYGLAPQAPASNLPLYIAGGAGLLVLVLLLRPRAPQS